MRDSSKSIAFIHLLPLVFFTLLISCKSKAQQDLKPLPTPKPVSQKTDVSLWLTKADRSALFQKQNIALNFQSTSNQYPTIEVDTTQSFQSIDGFGYTLTGGSATLINSLPKDEQDKLLKDLFTTDSNHIGVSYLRLSIGASDLSAAPFSYDDISDGETDAQLAHFSLDKEMVDLIPVLKKIVQLNPEIKFLGSPWSAQRWMKTNNSFKGGSLKPEFYSVYAQYLVKYIRAMKAQGITIDAITPQNEPLHPGNNPSMFMPALDQATFIKDHLGPAFKNAGLKTKIIVYDHNADRPDYPIAILKDPGANQYVDGSAFHLYGGSITALTDVHNAYPDKNIYFTEQWIGGPGDFAGDLQWHVETLIIGATRNWAKNVLEWNLASDPNYQPHTDDGGCTTCLGAITIAPSITRNPAYYIIAHAAKFVRPGSVRIASNITGSFQNVAFKTPQGKKVLIVLNTSGDSGVFNIKFNGKIVTAALDKGAVGTYIW